MSDEPLKAYPAVDAGHGVTRQVMAENPDLMVVEFRFGDGAIGALHNHVHVQSTYVKSGRFEFTVGDQTYDLGPGDALVVPSMVTHGCRAVEPGTLVDTFTPRRDDFL